MKTHRQSALITLALLLAQPQLGFAGGSDNHSHSPKKSVCTQEHADLGHCEMDNHSGAHGGHHASTVGSPATEAQTANRIVNVNLLDTMRFEFTGQFDVKAGDVVKFIVTNQGKVPHEFGIGSVEEQTQHRNMMKDMPHMKHEDGQTVTVAPGQTRTLTWAFSGEGALQYACNIPGHFEAGMYQNARFIP